MTLSIFEFWQFLWQSCGSVTFYAREFRPGRLLPSSVYITVHFKINVRPPFSDNFKTTRPICTIYTPNCREKNLNRTFYFEIGLPTCFTIENSTKMLFSHWLQCKGFWGITFVICVRITQPKRFYIVYSRPLTQIISQKSYCMSRMDIYMQLPPIGRILFMEWTSESVHKWTLRVPFLI